MGNAQISNNDEKFGSILFRLPQLSDNKFFMSPRAIFLHRNGLYNI